MPPQVTALRVHRDGAFGAPAYESQKTVCEIPGLLENGLRPAELEERARASKTPKPRKPEILKSACAEPSEGLETA